MYEVSKRKVEYFVLTFILDRHAVYIRYLGSAALRTDSPVNQGLYFPYCIAVGLESHQISTHSLTFQPNLFASCRLTAPICFTPYSIKWCIRSFKMFL